MALKMFLESLEGVSADVAKEYKKTEKDGKTVYSLDLEGYEDPGALKRAKDHEKEARKTAEAKLKELSSTMDTLQEELDNMRRGAIPKGDVAKLEESWKSKLDKREGELKGQLETTKKALQKLLVDNVAQEIATKLSTAPSVMLPHVRSRLTVEEVEGEFKTRILDKDGKPSAMSIDDLQKEFTSNKDFAPILVGSRASGSRASGGQGGSSASSQSNSNDLGKASAKDLVAHIQAKKQAGG